MTKTINLNASELSKLTGHNRFDDPEKTRNTILSRNGLSNVYVPKSNVEEQLLKINKNDLKKVKKELKLDVKASLKEIEAVIKKNVINVSLDKGIKEDVSREKVEKALKSCPTLQKTLESGIKHDLQMRRGNVKEEQNLNLTQKKEKIVIKERNSKMYNKILYKSPDGQYIINIRGKVDGITDDIIVETKNRTKRLFKWIPGYEQVQLEAYMFLTGLERALHIECYDNEQLKIDYEHNPEFWDECVKKIVDYVSTIVLLDEL
jgi:nitrogen fixation protein